MILEFQFHNFSVVNAGLVIGLTITKLQIYVLSFTYALMLWQVNICNETGLLPATNASALQTF